MSALFYLYRTRWKNRIKSLLKSPAQLIVAILIIALMVLNLFATKFEDKPVSFRDINELYALIIALYTLMFIMTSYNGTARGGSLFSMADVNLVFVSKIPPVKIMFYGLIQQLGTSILVGLFIIFQYGWLSLTYGVTVPFLLLILLGYSVCLLCGQVTSMVIYSFTSGSDKNKRIAKYGILALCAAAAGYIVYSGLSSKAGMLDGIVTAANSSAISLFPVAGWLKSAIIGAQSGQITYLVSGFIATLVYIGILVALLTKTGDSYFEDVLQTTEKMFQALTASKSGSIAEAAPENVKIGKTGLRRGYGADAFYYKHRLENRRARVFLFDIATIVFLAVSIIFSLFVRSEGLPMVFAMSTYMMIFSVALGRWVKELIKHYIYLLPEPPFKKLIHCLRDTLAKFVAEAVLLFGVMYFIIDMTVPELILAIIARISFGILFTSANLFIERFFSWITVKLLAAMIFFLSMLVFSVPGIAVAVILSTFQVINIPENLLILGSLAVCNIVVALITSYISRNMLEYAELNTAR